MRFAAGEAFKSGPRREGLHWCVGFSGRSGVGSPRQESGIWAVSRGNLGGRLGSRATRALKTGPQWDVLSLSSLLEVSFPLGLVLGCDDAIGLVAKDDPCWAESVERVKSVAMLQEGFGELVGVKGALGSKY